MQARKEGEVIPQGFSYTEGPHPEMPLHLWYRNGEFIVHFAVTRYASGLTITGDTFEEANFGKLQNIPDQGEGRSGGA